MNLKKILTVAAVSVAAAAFALLIVIFAMPKPEDRPRPDAKSFDTFAGFTFGDVLSEDAKKEGRTYVDLPCEIKTPWATFTRKGALYGRYTQKLYNVTIFEDDIPGLINGAKERNRVEKLWEMFRDAYDLKLKFPIGWSPSKSEGKLPYICAETKDGKYSVDFWLPHSIDGENGISISVDHNKLCSEDLRQLLIFR